jgi:hypothetical protein
MQVISWRRGVNLKLPQAREELTGNSLRVGFSLKATQAGEDYFKGG